MKTTGLLNLIFVGIQLWKRL